MLSIDNFVEDCRVAVQADASHRGIVEIMQRAFRDPGAVTTAIGEPTAAGVFPVYRSKDLTIINVVWKPGMSVMPHNHRMWAVIGIYGGREDNIFWRRCKDDPDSRIEAAGAKSLSTGDVTPLGADIIHSVTNPIPKLSGALHLYGGDFFDIERSEWDAEHLTEQPYDMEKAAALFCE